MLQLYTSDNPNLLHFFLAYVPENSRKKNVIEKRISDFSRHFFFLESPETYATKLGQKKFYENFC